MTLERRLALAALAIATAQSADARGDIGAAMRSADDAESLLRYDDDDPGLTDDPSPAWQERYDATELPDASGIDDERWPARY